MTDFIGAPCTRQPEVFFPDDKDYITLTYAQDLCDMCGFKDECLDLCLKIEATLGAQCGVWGGLSEKERDGLRKRKFVGRQLSLGFA